MNLQVCLPNTLINKGEAYEISVFKKTCTEVVQVQQVAKIKQSFPQLETSFFQVLLGRVRDLEMSDDRLAAAVNYVIDNCIYPTPTIAQFVGFDKSIELFDYQQSVKKNNELHGYFHKFHKAIRLQGHEKPFWAKVVDIEAYKLELFNK